LSRATNWRFPSPASRNTTSIGSSISKNTRSCSSWRGRSAALASLNR